MPDEKGKAKKEYGPNDPDDPNAASIAIVPETGKPAKVDKEGRPETSDQYDPAA